MKHGLIEKSRPKLTERLTELVELGEIMRVLADDNDISNCEREFFANVADTLDEQTSKRRCQLSCDLLPLLGEKQTWLEGSADGRN